MCSCYKEKLLYGRVSLHQQQYCIMAYTQQTTGSQRLKKINRGCLCQKTICHTTKGRGISKYNSGFFIIIAQVKSPLYSFKHKINITLRFPGSCQYSLSFNS